MAEEIQLTFKSPTDRVAPFVMKVDRAKTVGELKQLLRAAYPGEPLEDGQKMIYCGKLLRDEQTLRSVFEMDTSAIVHFICQPSINVNEDKNETSDNKDAVIEPNIELYKQYQNYVNNFYSSSMQSFTSMDQYQQMINQAYMQSYSNYYNQWNKANETVVPSVTSTEVIQRTVTNDASNQENPPNNERRIAPVDDNRLPNMVAAAFGGLMGDGGEDENDGEVEQRDILHYFYMFVRFGLLILICYYYSSMFSVVTTLMLFFLFFGVNFFRRNNHNNQQIRIPPAQDEVPTVPENLSGNIENTQDNSVPESTNENVPEVAPLPGMTDRLRMVANTSIQFVLTFFITLFPDPVAHINVN